MRNFIAKHKLASAIGAVVLVTVLYYFMRAKAAPTSYAVASAGRDTLVVSVSGTGQVSGQNQVDLKPLGSGQVVSVPVKAGQNVAVGQVIAMLDERSAEVALTQAQASLESARANYNKLMNGATTSSLAVNQVSVQSAQSSLANVYQDLLNKLNSDYNQANDAVRNQLGNLFNNPESWNPQMMVVSGDMQAQSDAEAGRAQATNELNAWKTELSNLGSSPSQSDLDAELQKVQSHLQTIKHFLSRASDALLFVPGSSGSTSTPNSAASYKNSVSQAASNVNQAISDLNSAGQGVTNAKNSLAQAQASLNQAQAPARTEDVQSAEAQVTSAEAQLQSAQNTYDNNLVRAPFAGQVAALDVQPGDQASAGTAVATLVTQNKIAEIALNEVDVANVQVGQNVTLTFDAIDGLTIAGKVIEVANVGQTTSGVVNYAVKIGFGTQDSRVKAGMSTTANIVTDIRPDVLVVPNSALHTQGTQHYVLTVNKQNLATSTANAGLYISSVAPTRQIVEIGKANDTETEITGGLNESDTIITQSLSGSSASTASAGSGGGLFRLGGGGGGAIRGGGAAAGR